MRLEGEDRHHHRNRAREFGEGIGQDLCREGAAVVVPNVNVEGGARVVSEIVAQGEPPSSSRRNVHES